MDTFATVSVFLGLQILFTVVFADVCYNNGQSEYCEYGCCDLGDSEFCCLSPFTIAGIVLGCISLLCFIIGMICCLCKKKQPGRVMQGPTQPSVFVVNSSNTTSSQSHSYSQPYGQPPKGGSYPPAQPLPPGYASTYNNPYSSGQPPYGSTVPPPAYTYNDPSNNPFSAAARNTTTSHK